MNYTHEKPVYPLIFEVFPAPKGEEASFTLYEDEGEDLGHQRDEFARTPVFRSRTEEGGYLLSVGAREGKRVCSARSPKLYFPSCISQDGSQRSYRARQESKEGEAGNVWKRIRTDDAESMVWSWDKATGICSLRMPDRGGRKSDFPAFTT